MKKSKFVTRVIGVICILISFALLFTLSLPTANEKAIKYTSHYGDKEVTLKGSYIEADGAEYAVLICPGYSCDRQKWRPFADLFAKNGYTVMSFDYSGQGASSGTIGFDNAKTDNIPALIDDSIEELHNLSGIDYDHIILVGHSMGGRSILRLLYDYNDANAQTRVEKREIKNVILMSPEVNYNFNAQASLFAGTSDADEEPWKSYSESCINGTDVYLYGSTADDIVSDEDVLRIAERMGVENLPEGGKIFTMQTNSLGSKVTVGITTGVLHSYEMYSPKFASFVNDALTEISSNESVFNPLSMSLVYYGWALGLIGILLTLMSLNMNEKWEADDNLPVLTDSGKFLRRKLLLWLAGTLMAFLVCCVCVAMPFGSPVMNIPYMCFISGYGIVMLIAYRKGKFKGTEGKLPKLTLKSKAPASSMLKCVGVSVAICFFVWYVMRATMYRLIPLNFRLFWVIFASILMAIGYYVSGCETDMLERANASVKVKILYNLIQYVPLFLLIAFYLVLRSYSGLIGQTQNMVLMYIFCIPLGNYIKKRTSNRFYGAIITAFLFQTVMITSAALISLF